MDPIRQKLAKVGVFKGFDGLKGLYEADNFWDQQPYGTRLYYGDGNFDYLHRHVLGAVVEILSAVEPKTLKEKMEIMVKEHPDMRSKPDWWRRLMVGVADMIDKEKEPTDDTEEETA